jgi:hypothetical protein
VIAERLRELGIVPPEPFPPGGTYDSCVVDNGMAYVSGHGPIAGDTIIRDKVGTDVSVERARKAARIVRVFGMVNAAPGFDQMPAVINGCSDPHVDVFGDAGRHARSGSRSSRSGSRSRSS